MTSSIPAVASSFLSNSINKCVLTSALDETTKSIKYEIAFQSKADHSRTGYTITSCDVDLDLMTLIYKLDLLFEDVPAYQNAFSRSRLSKVKKS